MIRYRCIWCVYTELLVLPSIAQYQYADLLPVNMERNFIIGPDQVKTFQCSTHPLIWIGYWSVYLLLGIMRHSAGAIDHDHTGVVNLNIQ